MPREFVHLPHMRELDSSATHVETPCGEGTMKWRLWGAGDPLVLLHGAHGSWLHWQYNIAELARHYRVIVPDIPGFGESAVIEPLDSPEAHAQVLAEGLAKLLPDSQPADVVGFSAGAFLGCHLDVAAPGRVRRLVMADAGGLDTPMRWVEMVSMRGLDTDQRWEANRINLARFMYHDAGRVDDGAIVMSALEAPRMRSRFVIHIVPDKLLPIARKVRAPIDLVWGEFDYPHPDPEANLAMVHAFQPEARLRVIHGAGHWPMGERPEAFNTAVLDLLSLPPRPRLA